MEDEGSKHGYRTAQRLGLFLGAFAFFVILLLPAPAGLSAAGWRTAAVSVLMAVWWMTEALPIPATALLPLALFPTLGILSTPASSAPYANELIFLFMGGFLLAVTMERWGLHKRIALTIMSWVGTSPPRLVLGFMLATAFISMWISNTATTAMMLPIALAVGEMLRPPDQEDGIYHFGIALMLGVAYASSIGGVATLIGTPPNAVLAGAASELLHEKIGFVQWMGVGVPVAAVMLPATWLILTRVLHRPGELHGDAAGLIERERAGLGSMGRGEKMTATVFVLTALAWVLRSQKTIGSVTIPGLQTWLPEVQDSTIAMAAAAVLFILPVDWRRGEFCLDWKTAKRIPWGVLVLFGGGLSLAVAMDQSGLAKWIGGRRRRPRRGPRHSGGRGGGDPYRLPHRADLERRHGQHGHARHGRGGGRTRDGAAPPHDHRGARGVHGIHAPGGHSSECHRLQLRLPHDSTDGSGGVPSEYPVHRRHHDGGHTPDPLPPDPMSA